MCSRRTSSGVSDFGVGDKFNAELPSLTYVRAIKPKAFTKSQKYCSRPTLNQARAEE